MPDKENQFGTKNEWFEYGEHDLQTARLLFREGGYVNIIAYHLQQAIEKYLKGFLISKGWHLKKTHDLRELLDRAIEFNPDFNIFLKLARQLTAFYLEERYPVGPPTDYSREEMTNLVNQTEDLISRIKDNK